MRIVSYRVELDADNKNVLIKESSKNYTKYESLNSPRKIKDMLNDMFHADKLAEEHMWLLAFDTRCHSLGVFQISHGTVDRTIISSREIFIRLCLCGATYFVLAHNHPSGCVEPSNEDVTVTETVTKAGELMNIKMLDHIIVGKDCYYSFQESSELCVS